jgi:hypothetical protein
MYHLAKKLPSVELLKERFEIDPSSPTGLRYKSNVGKKFKAGEVAGTYANALNRYIVGFNYRRLQVSRVVWKLAYGTDPEQVIDHIDNNPMNNDISNLRDISQGDNMTRGRWGKEI